MKPPKVCPSCDQPIAYGDHAVVVLSPPGFMFRHYTFHAACLQRLHEAERKSA